MFIETRHAGYNRDGEQFAQGEFLIVVQDPNGDFRNSQVPELRALVRFVRMTQCGHFMMANVTIGGFHIVLSGAYGSDGLPVSLSQHFPNGPAQLTDEEKQYIWDQLVEIPTEIQKEFWDGGGHNCAGKEGPVLRKWARDNMKDLKKRVHSYS